MKLRFEPDLDFQLQAVDAVCDLFQGQETCRTEFTVTRDRMDGQERHPFTRNDLGVGNRLTLLDREVLANLNDVQLRNGVPPSPSLDSGNFTVEMETGTGKTHVYLRITSTNTIWFTGWMPSMLTSANWSNKLR